MKHHQVPTALLMTGRGLTLSLTLAACALTTLAGEVEPPKVRPAIASKQLLFPPGAVRLLDGPFKTNQELDHAYLLRLEPDRLLAQFRVEAGLEPKAKPYGGWESPAAPGTTRSLAGHSLGHYLSALSLMFRATDDPVLRERVSYIARELKQCQEKRGDGSLVAFPHARELEADIRKGKVETTDNYWAPFYTIHKEIAGLRDAWLCCADATAKEVMMGLADWCGSLVKDLTDEQRERFLNVEHGGMAEVLADVYAITGENRFLDYARFYSHHLVLDPLAKGNDTLTGMHANTQVPKFTGFQRIHQLGGDADYGAAAVNFWDTVVNNRTWVNGGNSIHEHFSDPKAMGADITHDGGPETCNTYNMLRLTAALYQEKPDSVYLDYYENALFNHILTSQAPLPGAGAFVYYTPLRPDYARSYGTDFNSFWCCTGTGMENHAKYGEFIYTHHADTVSVNLFMASTLEWSDTGLALRQETRFPEEQASTLVITKAPAQPLTLRIRHPFWLDAKELKLTVNGETTAAPSDAGFAEIKRQWKAGDKVHIALPMTLRVVRKSQSPGWISLFNGPILLAGELGAEGLEQKDFIGPYTPIKAFRSLKRAPIFVAKTDEEVLANISPVAGRPGVFHTKDLAKPHDVTLAPFFRTHFQRYALYWQLTDAKGAAQLQLQLAEAERAERELDARTADRVRLGEQQPETDHLFKAEKSRSGLGPDARHYRAAEEDGWFGFEMKPPPQGTPAAVRLSHWGRDHGPEFDIEVAGKVIATARMQPTHKEDYLGVEYPIPAEVLNGKTSVAVRIVSRQGKPVPAVYDLRLVTSNQSR